MLLTDEYGRKLVTYLLLNGYSMNNIGLLNGKAGLALTLFEASRYWQDDAVEEHAFNVLQAALLGRPGDISVGHGMSGVGCVLAYLIRNGLVEADYRELFGDRHDAIMRTILQDHFRMKDSGEYVRLLLFLEMVGQSGTNGLHEKVTGKLFHLLDEGVRLLSGEDIRGLDSNYFFRFAAGILHLAVQFPTRESLRRMVEMLMPVAQKLSADARICVYPEFARALWRYGKLRQDPQMMAWGEIQAQMILKNIIPGISDLRELTDAVLLVRETGMARELLTRISGYFAGPCIEQRLGCAVAHPAYYPGVAAGVARLLLTDIYLKKGNTAIAELLSLTL